MCPGQVAWLEHYPLDQKFDSWSRHIPRLQVSSSVKAYTEGKKLMSLPLSPSLPPSLLCPFPSL